MWHAQLPVLGQPAQEAHGSPMGRAEYEAESVPPLFLETGFEVGQEQPPLCGEQRYVPD